MNRIAVISVQRLCKDSDIYSEIVRSALQEYLNLLKAGQLGQEQSESFTSSNGALVTILAGEIQPGSEKAAACDMSASAWYDEIDDGYENNFGGENSPIGRQS